MKTKQTLIQLTMLVCLLAFHFRAGAQSSCQANFTWTQSTANTLVLTSTSTGTTANTYYQWNFGDNNYGWGINGGTHFYNVPGTYTACLSIYDSINSNNCNSTYCGVVTVTGTVVCNLSASVYMTPATCSTCTNGAATANPAGGSAPYTYSWSPGSATTASISNLAPGNYTVFVTDSNGCTASATDSVRIAPPPCQANFTWVQTSPNTITFTNTSSNTPNLTIYDWNFGDNGPGGYGANQVYTYNVPGTYTVCLTISDSSNINGCFSVFCDTIHVTGTVICNLVGTTNSANASCNTCNDGYATVVSVYGGTAPYNYSWSNGGTTQSISGLAPGTYTVCITDANNCNVCYPVTVGVNSNTGPCSAYFTLTPDTVNLGNYWANNMASGTGVLHYQWNWGDNSPMDSTANPSHTYAGPGFYYICLTITDSVGCTSTYCDTLTAVRLPSWAASHHTTVNVRQVQTTGIKELSVLSSWSMYPNPSSGLVNISYSLSQNSSVEVGLYDLLGQEITKLESNTNQVAGTHQIILDGAGLKAGMYMVRILANGKPETHRLSIVK